MKWIAIVAFIVIGFYWTNLLRSNSRHIFTTGLILGFLPFVVGPWHLIVAPFAIPMWSGYCKGWEISLIDVIALSSLFVLNGKMANYPLKWPLIIYSGVVLITTPLATFPMFALSYFIQIVRMLVVFFAAAKISARPDGAKGLIYGLVAGLAFQFVIALEARLHGAIQTGGSFGHQNMLGYVTHMVLLPSFALLIAGRWKPMAMLGVFVGGAVVIMTASRATIMVAGVGVVITYIAVSVINWTDRKATFGIITAGLMILAIPLAQNALDRRFTAAGGGALFAEDQERIAFESAAHMMMKDHPFGVGPNHYVYFANVGGYNDRANITWAVGSRSTNVHNTYLLIGAETGYLGVLSFISLIFSTVFYCLYYAKKYKREGYSELIAGVGVSILCVGLHSKLEWMFVTYQAQYIIFLAIGIASGCILQSKRRARRRYEEARAAQFDEDQLLPVGVI